MTASIPTKTITAMVRAEEGTLYLAIVIAFSRTVATEQHLLR